MSYEADPSYREALAQELMPQLLSPEGGLLVAEANLFLRKTHPVDTEWMPEVRTTPETTKGKGRVAAEFGDTYVCDFMVEQEDGSEVRVTKQLRTNDPRLTILSSDNLAPGHALWHQNTTYINDGELGATEIAVDSFYIGQ